MLAIGLGITMAVLDSAVANVALPTIARELHTTPAASIWVINAYQLAMVVSLLPCAAVGDIVGYRRVYSLGLLLFTLASGGCALCHTLPALTTCRAVQGLGAAGIMSVNGALVRYTYPLDQLGAGIGLNALVVSIASAIGPTVASAILSVGSWSWLFAVNVPIGVVNLALASRVLPWSQSSGARFDYVSALLNTLVFGLLFTGVDVATHGGRGGVAIAVCELALAALAGVALIRREAPQARPLIPIDLMRVPVFALSVAVSICSFMAQIMAFLALPFYFEGVMHRSQVETGLLITPWPLALGMAAPLAGRLSDKVPAAILGAIGLAAFAVGLTSLALLPAHATTLDIVWRMALCGLGFGFFQSPNNRTLLLAAPRDRAGAAGGMLAMARITGMTSGAALAALAFRLKSGHAETACLMIGTGLALLAAVASLARLSGRAAAAQPLAAQPPALQPLASSQTEIAQT